MNLPFTTFYIIRHGECADNVLLNQGTQTISKAEFGSRLTGKGRDQALKAAHVFKNIQFDAAFSSDLLRARETAEILLKGRNIQVVETPDIRERNFGSYSHKLVDLREEIKSVMSTLTDQEKMKYKHDPTMESWEEVGLRLENFLKEKTAQFPGKTILVVGHGNLMRAFLVHIGKAKFDDLPAGSIVNTGYFKVTTDGKTFEVGEMRGVNFFLPVSY